MLGLSLFVSGNVSAAPPSSVDVDFFESKVRPILVEKCDSCHSARAKRVRGNLLLDSRQGWLRGGDSGPAIVPGDPEKSLFIRAIRHSDSELEMPPSGKLPDDAIATLTEWVRRGAPDPRVSAGDASAAKKPTGMDLKTGRKHWAFQPLKPVTIPEVSDPGWCRNQIDRFILAGLDAKGLKPNRPLSRERFLRRLSLDLNGLPPTEEELDTYLGDTAPDAEARIIAAALANPAHGERWGRHWLDLARFAESHGFEHDTDRPTAFPYRDFVIDAINRDLPYDTFVRWQVAGDEIAPDDPQALRATGFLACGVHSTQITANQAEKERYDELDDMVGTIGTAFLGLTVGCARCHDHKFDPITQRDYYRMVANFTTTVRSEPRLPNPLVPGSRITSLRRVVPSEMIAVGAWPHPISRLAIYGSMDALKSTGRDLITTMISTEGLPAVRLHTQGPDFYEKVFLLKRGDPNLKQGQATPGFPRVLTASTTDEGHWKRSPPKGWRTTYRRRALADWMIDTDQGAGALLARVIVNRLWQHNFGRGLVTTASDFGEQGERPSHPELLDWLAAELIRGSWRLKPIQALIVDSAAYRQDGHIDPAKVRLDPDNRTFWRNPGRRLEAEAIRDSILAVSGTLDRRMFGPGTLDEKQTRRSVYFTVKRSQLVPMMLLFDAPDALQGLAVRTSTTVAPQSLLLMNSPVVRSWAESFARRVLSDFDLDRSESTSRDQVTRLVTRTYRMAIARPPSGSDLDDAIAFIDDQRRGYAAEGKSSEALALALTDFCQTTFALNEFIFND